MLRPRHQPDVSARASGQPALPPAAGHLGATASEGARRAATIAKSPGPRLGKLGPLLAALAWLAPGVALANSTGISAASFGSNGCADCHSASPATSASLSFGSTPVVGQPVTITVTVSGPRSAAGFNLQMGGGSFDDPPGSGAQIFSATEAAHDSPNTSSSWTLTWTPSSEGSVGYTLWGNSVDQSGDSTGDAAMDTPVTSTVTVKRPRGAVCSTGSQCGTGFCVDGVCCDTACDGTCQACTMTAGGQASNGTCSALVAGSGECCSTGFYWNGSSCVLDDPCAAGVDECVSIASCNDAPGLGPSYTCDCPHAGYGGDGRTLASGGTDCFDIDECTPDPCGANGTGCTQDPIGSWSSPGYTCSCAPGYAFDGATCVLQNECTAGTDDCHPVASCMDPSTAAGDFTCTCPAGYVGDGHTSPGTGCTDIDECAMGLDDCDANATCTNTPGSFTCACDSGWTGDGQTCTDVDECADPAFLSMCDVNSTCNNLPGSFECVCNDGWSGDGLVACTDVDECADGTDDCDANATCTNTPGSFTCACDSGWTGDGQTCTDVDECADPALSGRCSSVATCNNLPGDWECVCDPGFRGDGFTCEDIDECAEGTAGCDANATCRNENGSYSCECNSGYRGSGFSCADIDECAEGTHGCALQERCVNQLGTPNLCVCAPGYERDADSGECVISCGDGSRAPGEECDDGNAAAGDGCSEICEIEPGWACWEPTGAESTCAETCGDGRIDEGEECDDGDDNSNTAADACRETCVRAHCGDGTVDTGEECDDGPDNDDAAVDGCRTSCHLPYCGDGVVDTGEVCDPGGGVPGAAPAGLCTTMCGADAGLDPSDPPALTGGACSCRAAPGHSSAPAWLLAALALLGLARRRR